jgi:hypothetical protein
MTIKKRPAWVMIASIIAVVFGVMTIKSGGSVLFIDGEARHAAGNYVDFVLWFNFLAGFFYIATGIGIWLEKAWATMAAIIIVVLTLLVFGAFGVHILNGGEYEQRTVIAMSMRTLVWAAIAITSWRQLWHTVKYHGGKIL